MNSLLELNKEEARLAWEEYTYHNLMCDAVSYMLKYGRDKVINDMVDMYESMEAIND